ncbi:RimK family alpha-L-glutamate ligase [Massilia violaceinigra]|uniref:RimK family alpha-L-glutamate ligase n=1 Tax=Massilia violaceinigra TaxID=2045208 RepID=A0A2D2DIW5_9BURK|nr:RimK family protein [Massilia violaceinigra]ATQ74924.1 RimK family alpha-L-glutamate ligase [Massilia violaceinigra]
MRTKLSRPTIAQFAAGADDDPKEPPATARVAPLRARAVASRLIIVVEQLKDWPDTATPYTIVTAAQFLGSADQGGAPGSTVINLCRSYKYLSVGYYCSLLAEARGQAVLPSVKTINDLSRKAIYGLDTDQLDYALNQSLEHTGERPMPVEFSMDIYFGTTEYTPLVALARQIFETFPTPLMRVEFERDEDWKIGAIRVHNVSTLSDAQLTCGRAALRAIERAPMPAPAPVKPYRYHIAILRDPDEELPPSNEAALERFVDVGRELAMDITLIEKKDFSRLAEFDALFIRETTAINHHTYLFAKKAESEGMVVIDDPMSILRCTNKVYLADLLRLNKIPTPHTYALQRTDIADIGAIEREIGYPMVMKIPDGAFSRGVTKVANAEQFQQTAQALLTQSALILVQEYMYTDFDWRIGVLNRKAIFASKYFMSKNHWQIAKRDAGGQAKFGAARAVALDEVPPDLLAYAVAAANLIGDGLYGVDMKMTTRGPVVIEVNDNPNIDAGNEDSVLGNDMYRIVLRDLVRRLDIAHGLTPVQTESGT